MPPKKQQQAIQSYDFVQESFILQNLTLESTFKEGKTIEGKIYDGRLLIQLEASNAVRNIKKKIYF